MSRIRPVLAGGAVALVAGAAIAWILWVQPAPPSAAPAKGPAATAEVTRGPLVDTRTMTGTLAYGELSALRPILEGDAAMLTWIAPVGATVARGEPLYAIDGQPAILLYGSIPQHRTLRFELDSPTPVWVELETAETGVETARLTLTLEREKSKDAAARAADATARLADGLSSAPAMPEFVQLTGAVRAAEAKLGRVRELSSAELAPAIDVAAAEAELAATRSALDAALRSVRKDLAAASLDAVTARVAVAAAELKLDAAEEACDALRARMSDDGDIRQLAGNLAALGYQGSLPAQVRAFQQAAGLPVTGIVGPSQIVIAAGPVHIAAHSANVGEALAASSPDRSSILDYSSIEKLVTVPVAVGDQALVAVGRAVTITLPDDSAVKGTIVEVGSVVTDGAIEVKVAIADQAALGTLEVASVDAEFVSDSRDDVLSVPITALLARPEGGFAVELASGAASILVPVDTGLFAAGRVEITGEGIAEGARVGVPG